MLLDVHLKVFNLSFLFIIKKHIQAVHDGVKYGCGECDYKASYKNNLNEYTRVVDEGI